MTPIESFPLTYLEIITPRLKLRLADNDELDVLARAAVGKILKPEQEDWMAHWSQVKSPELEKRLLQHHWRRMADFTVNDWHLNLVVFFEEKPIGSGSLAAENFLQRRSISSGSWIIDDYRGRGLGKEIRAGLVQLGFEKLGAEEMRSGAHIDNLASQRVSLSLGYKRDGSNRLHGPGDGVRFLLRSSDWESRSDIEICGFDRCQQMFGI